MAKNTFLQQCASCTTALYIKGCRHPHYTDIAEELKAVVGFPLPSEWSDLIMKKLNSITGVLRRRKKNTRVLTISSVAYNCFFPELPQNLSEGFSCLPSAKNPAVGIWFAGENDFIWLARMQVDHNTGAGKMEHVYKRHANAVEEGTLSEEEAKKILEPSLKRIVSPAIEQITDKCLIDTAPFKTIEDMEDEEKPDKAMEG